MGVGCICNGATDCLKDQREHVAADEDDCVGPATETGQGFSVDHDNATEAQIDGGGQEAWGYGENDNVPIASRYQQIAGRNLVLRQKELLT